MNSRRKNGKGGFGIGGASIVLIFAVLCLTIFTLITYTIVSNARALVEAESRLMEAFYEADALAEKVLTDIITLDRQGEVPDRLAAYGHEFDIHFDYDLKRETDVAYFFCPIDETKSLLVSVTIGTDTYEVLSWRMIDTNEWSPDTGINIWDGN